MNWLGFSVILWSSRNHKHVQPTSIRNHSSRHLVYFDTYTRVNTNNTTSDTHHPNYNKTQSVLQSKVNYHLWNVLITRWFLFTDASARVAWNTLEPSMFENRVLKSLAEDGSARCITMWAEAGDTFSDHATEVKGGSVWKQLARPDLKET